LAREQVISTDEVATHERFPCFTGGAAQAVRELGKFLLLTVASCAIDAPPGLA
jgi:hypothetical protein